jgi:hypothetical protein
MDTESAEQASHGESDNMIAVVPDLVDDSASSSKKKKTNAAQLQPATARKGGKAKGQPRQSVRGAAKDDKLVCRYCGSDDLSPSFKKRHDARCRACFKKRYASARSSKKSLRSRRGKAAD